MGGIGAAAQAQGDPAIGLEPEDMDHPWTINNRRRYLKSVHGLTNYELIPKSSDQLLKFIQRAFLTY